MSHVTVTIVADITGPITERDHIEWSAADAGREFALSFGKHRTTIISTSVVHEEVSTDATPD